MATPASAHGGSACAGRAAAEEALALVLPALEAAVRDPRISGTGCLAVVLLDPGLEPGDVPLEQAVLLEHAIGRDHWDADYMGFARAKAALAWRMRQDGHAVHALAPQRLRPGDSLLRGGTWLDGIVVGVSGAQAAYDEAFGLWIAAALRAVAKRRAEAAFAEGARVA